MRVIDDSELREEPYAELGAEEIGEGGQLRLALHPDFEKNSALYAYYTTDEDGVARNRIVQLVGENGLAREKEVLLEWPASSIHAGARVAFGPDGKLYATLGDTAEASLAQGRDALASKIVRLNPDGSVPKDTPPSLARPSTPTVIATHKSRPETRRGTSMPPSMARASTTN